MNWLFDYSPFMPRTCCVIEGEMPTWIVVTYITASLLIWLCYFAIPAVLYWNINQLEKALPRPFIILFSAFVFACGVGHAVDATMFHYPRYRLMTVIHSVTAIISLITAFYLTGGVNSVLKKVSFNIEERQLLKASLSRLRQLDAAIYLHPQPYAIYDNDMRLLTFSKSWQEIFELGDLRDLEGKTHYEIFPSIELDKPEWKEHHQRALAGEELQGEDEFRGARLSWFIGPIETKRNGKIVINGMFMALRLEDRKDAGQ